VQTTWYPALHTFSEYRDTVSTGDLSRAGEVADRHCVLPLSAVMDEADVDAVVDVVAAVFARSA
jgi:dTDP-4-amino-4,6-dideoxygalactose transaminase